MKFTDTDLPAIVEEVKVEEVPQKRDDLYRDTIERTLKDIEDIKNQF